MRVWAASITVLSLGVMAGQALGQVPPTADPGRLGERFKPPDVPKSTAVPVIPQATQPLLTDRELKAQFLLNSVSVDGATAFTASAFEDLYRPLLGKQVSLLGIYRVRDAITARYRAAGFTLSQAIIPPQSLEGGVVHIQIVEGYIDKVTVEGDAKDPRGLIDAMAQKIRRSRPLLQRDLERYILLLDDLPGVDVRTVLKPSSATPGAADLLVVVTRHPLDGTVSVDNRGSKAIGPEEASLGFSANNVIGLDEQTSLFAATAFPTERLQYFSLNHTEVLGSEGQRLTFSASNALSNPGGAISALSARGTGTVLGIFLSTPVIRTRAKSLTLEAGFTYQNSATDLLSMRYSRDKVRYGTARATFDFSDTLFGSSASTLIRAEMDMGFNVLGASAAGSANLSRANGRSDYTLFEGEITRVQRLIPGLSLAVSLSGQYSYNPLLSPQQFGVGGSRFGRGYEPSEITGDDGVAMSIEPRVDLPVNIPATTIQAYAFYDAAEVWVKAPLAGQRDTESLSAAGIGVRINIGAHVMANLELAKPLTRNVASRGNRQIRPFFSIATSF